MLLYNIRIALKSLRRNPILTALLIAAIALGICVSTTFVALRHVFEKDPLPGGKSKTMFNVRLDSWDPSRPYNPDQPDSVPTMLSYRDMRALMQSKIPTRQTGTYKTTYFVFPDPKVSKPFREDVRLAFSDFFGMFDVPFLYGAPWDKSAEAKPEAVVVISKELNGKLFAGANSVGKTIRLGDRDFKIVGVMDEWRPAVRFFEFFGQNKIENVFMPFNFTAPLQIRTTGNSDGWKGVDGNGYEAFLNSETTWITFWVELPTAEQQQSYRDLVVNYMNDQKKHGRFPRPLNYRVITLPALMEEFGAVPSGVKPMSIVSLLFLVVCSLNLVGLLLGKFLARVPEVSVRRALGASKWQVFWQHVVECELVGIIGGAIGMLLSIGVLQLIAKLLPDGMGAHAVRLDLEMAIVSVILSLGAGLLAGIYPSWRICSIAPAMQLKVQ